MVGNSFKLKLVIALSVDCKISQDLLGVILMVPER